MKKNMDKNKRNKIKNESLPHVLVYMLFYKTAVEPDCRVGPLLGRLQRYDNLDRRFGGERREPGAWEGCA